MNKKIVYLFLFLLIAGISLSPRLPLGVLSIGRTIDIRAEDVILCLGSIVLLFGIFVSGKYKLQLPPLFWPIVAWSGFGLFSVSMNLLLGEINFNFAFFYLLKEIEFFVLYLVVFFCISNFDLRKQLVKHWFFFTLVNIFWLEYVFIFDVKWSIFYGANMFAEPQGPFPSGGYFLLVFIFLFNLFIFYYNKIEISKLTKISLLGLSLSPILGVILSGSMASAIGLFCAIFVSLFLLLKDRINSKTFAKITIFVVVALGILLLSIQALPVNKRIISFSKIKREYVTGSTDSRIGILKNHLSIILSSPSNLIMGLGVRGEAHSQYMRIALERGLVGLFLFFWLMWSILKISYNKFKTKDDLFKKGLCAGLLVSTIAMLVMSIPNDVFMTVKPAEVYWFFAAMALAI